MLRNATVYGPSPRMRFDLLINAMVASSFFNNTITFYSNPMVKRPLINIKDLCQVFIYFVQNDLEFDTYNIGRTIDNYSIADIAVRVAQAFYEKFGVDISLRYKIDDADPRSYLVSFEKLHEHTRDVITHNVTDGISELIDLFHSNFSQEDKQILEATSYNSIQHLVRRINAGELNEEFRVLK